MSLALNKLFFCEFVYNYYYSALSRPRINVGDNILLLANVTKVPICISAVVKPCAVARRRGLQWAAPQSVSSRIAELRVSGGRVNTSRSQQFGKYRTTVVLCVFICRTTVIICRTTVVRTSLILHWSNLAFCVAVFYWTFLAWNNYL